MDGCCCLGLGMFLLPFQVLLLIFYYYATTLATIIIIGPKKRKRSQVVVLVDKASKIPLLDQERVLNSNVIRISLFDVTVRMDDSSWARQQQQLVKSGVYLRLSIGEPIQNTVSKNIGKQQGINPLGKWTRGRQEAMKMMVPFLGIRVQHGTEKQLRRW